METLTCPVCGASYQNLKEYFACWTGHLEEKYLGENSNGLIPFIHEDAIKFLRENPSRIESGLRIIGSEIGVFHGRIDLIGVDKNKRLVLIDVDNGHDFKRKAEQLRRYRKGVQKVGTHVFALRLDDIPPIRMLIVNPNKFIKEVT